MSKYRGFSVKLTSLHILKLSIPVLNIFFIGVPAFEKFNMMLRLQVVGRYHVDFLPVCFFNPVIAIYNIVSARSYFSQYNRLRNINSTYMSLVQAVVLPVNLFYLHQLRNKYIGVSF